VQIIGYNEDELPYELYFGNLSTGELDEPGQEIKFVSFIEDHLPSYLISVIWCPIKEVTQFRLV